MPVLEVVVALVSGIIASAATVLASRSNRPSKTRSLVDASGLVIQQLSDEIKRLDGEVIEARADAEGARTEARAARDAERNLLRRVRKLESALLNAGIDPNQINGNQGE
jgi:outer membrane murein-binding lipoprotein Lpp